MKTFRYFLLFLIWICSYNAKATGGCLVGGNILYTDEATGGISVNLLSAGIHGYTETNGIPINACFSGTLGSGTCKVCDGTITAVYIVDIYVMICTKSLLVAGDISNGVYYSDYVFNCNMDHYAYLLGLGMGAFGLIVIRKRNKS